MLRERYDYDKTVFYESTDFKNARREMYGMAKATPCRAYDIRTILHHESHYAAAYFSAPFIPDSTVVIDAIGEFDTASIWVDGVKVWNKTYPWSLGLFYSAITKRIGLKPNEDEYITMGMAAYGDIRIDMTKEIHQESSSWNQEKTVVLAYTRRYSRVSTGTAGISAARHLCD